MELGIGACMSSYQWREVPLMKPMRHKTQLLCGLERIQQALVSLAIELQQPTRARCHLSSQTQAKGSSCTWKWWLTLEVEAEVEGRRLCWYLLKLQHLLPHHHHHWGFVWLL